LRTLDPSEIATSIVSFEEQTRGWLSFVAKARTMAAEIDAYRRLHGQLDVFCGVRVVDFDASAATRFQQLIKLRLRVGTMDLRVTSITLAPDATVLTRNYTDFRQVPGLRFDDWTR
jgi:tRNA(fMet)-specific endonuclease VapC